MPGPQRAEPCSQVTCLATQRATTGPHQSCRGLHTPREKGWLTASNHTSRKPLGLTEAGLLLMKRQG